MPRYRLRYQSTDLEMPVGEFVIGRSSSCHLALDDALVSRRHAVAHVAEDGVVIEDLGSRNGVLVNGKRIEGRQPLEHLDRVSIGSQEMVLLEGERPAEEQADGPARRTLAQTMEFQLPGFASDTEEPTTSGFRMIATIADKALAMNRFEEAERLLASQLDMLAGESEEAPPPEDQMQEATRFALRLAEGLQRPRWIDWTFRVHTVTGRLMPADTIDQLYELVRKVHYGDPKPLREYLQVIRTRADRFSAAERFLLRRLEGLERVIIA